MEVAQPQAAAKPRPWLHLPVTAWPRSALAVGRPVGVECTRWRTAAPGRPHSGAALRRWTQQGSGHDL